MHAGAAAQDGPTDEAGLIDLTADDVTAALAPDQAAAQQEQEGDEVQEVGSDSDSEVVAAAPEMAAGGSSGALDRGSLPLLPSPWVPQCGPKPGAPLSFAAVRHCGERLMLPARQGLSQQRTAELETITSGSHWEAQQVIKTLMARLRGRGLPCSLVHIVASPAMCLLAVECGLSRSKHAKRAAEQGVKGSMQAGAARGRTGEQPQSRLDGSVVGCTGVIAVV